jgi:hypothetical protein
MRPTVHDAKVMKTVAAIRDLQLQASQLDCARAEQERHHAEERLENGRAATRSAEQGWISALDNVVFDPGLSRFWLREHEAREAEERALAETFTRAGQEADARRRTLQIAQARSEAAAGEARILARTAARRRDEARLAAVEDQFNARRKQP